MSARTAAQAITTEIRSGDLAAALRLTIQAIDHFRKATSENEIADFLKRPTAIPDDRWDTLLATAIAWDAQRRGITPPRWTRRPPLESEWVPGPAVNYSHEYTEFLRSNSEPMFLERGIVLRERDLAAA